MANVFIEESTMQAIGNAIRAKTGKEEGILPSDMPAQIDSIEVGSGGSDGSDDAYTDGYNAAVEDFSTAQAHSHLTGALLTDCRYKYAGYGWNDESFAIANSAYSIDGLGITYAQSMFTYCRITNIDMFLDFSNVTTENGFYCPFANAAYLKRIKGIKFPNLSKATTPFTTCNRLETIDEIVGEIPFTISFQWCPLKKDTIMRVLNALSDTTTGMTCTFKKTAVNAAFETSEGANDGSTSTEWTSLVSEASADRIKPNWTIALK